MIVAGLLSVALSAGSGCIAVNADRIFARDLTTAAPAFSALPTDTAVALAPGPGARRILGLAELQRIAARHGLALKDADDICFERASAPLTADAVLAAARRSFPDSGVKITVTDFLRGPVPAGELVLPRSGLAERRNGDSIWRGHVVYAGRKRFPVWAEVRVVASERRVVAVEELAPGRPIAPGQIRLDIVETLPSAVAFASSLQEVAGKAPRRRMPAGSAIRADQLEAAQEVRRGETITVEVQSGPALVRFEARAESSGGRGATVTVRNPSSGHVFRALVRGPGAAVLDLNQ